MGRRQIRQGLLRLFLVSSAVGVAWLISSPNITQFAISTESPESEEFAGFNEIGSADDRSVEVDGLRFEVVLSDVEVGERDQLIPEVNTFEIPEKPEFRDGFAIYSPESYTTIYITLRITNQTDRAVFFPRFIQVKPALFNQAEQPITESRFCYEYHPFNPIQAGSALISPGQTINIVYMGILSWLSDDNLKLSFASKYIDNPDCFMRLTDGDFEFELTYTNQMDEIDIYDLDPRIFSIDPAIRESVTEPLLSKPVRDVWKGAVVVPEIQFELVNP